jgi:hypothetical protein
MQDDRRVSGAISLVLDKRTGGPKEGIRSGSDATPAIVEVSTHRQTMP